MQVRGTVQGYVLSGGGYGAHIGSHDIVDGWKLRWYRSRSGCESQLEDLGMGRAHGRLENIRYAC